MGPSKHGNAIIYLSKRINTAVGNGGSERAYTRRSMQLRSFFDPPRVAENSRPVEERAGHGG
eukprot:3784009-Pyramimonas_sp.AAC.1